MLRLNRKRWPTVKLRAQYACPNGHEPMFFTCWLKTPYPQVYGRPKQVFCDCGAEMAYEGLVSKC